MKKIPFLSFILPTIGVLALVFGSYLVAQGQPDRPSEDPTINPPTVPGEFANKSSSSFIGAIGVTEPSTEEVSIGVNRNGIITDVLVKAGDAVSKGDLLFSQDPRAAKATIGIRQSELEFARNQLESALAEIPVLEARVKAAETQIQASKSAIGSAEAEIERFKAELADRNNRFQISESLRDSRALSKEQRDERRFAVAKARADVESATSRLKEAESRLATSEAQLVEAQAQLELYQMIRSDQTADGPIIKSRRSEVSQAEANLALAEVELEYLNVSAPFDGSILQLRARPGEFAQSGGNTTSLAIMGRLDPLHVRVQIDEVDIPKFESRMTAWASPRGAAGQRYEMNYVRTEPLIIPKRNLAGNTSELVDTRIMEVIYAVNDEAASLLAGQQVDVYLGKP